MPVIRALLDLSTDIPALGYPCISPFIRVHPCSKALFPRLSTGSADLLERGVRRDRLRIDLHVDHRRFSRSEAALEGRRELRGVLDDLAHRAEGPRERREVRIADLGTAHAAGIVLFLV